MDVLFVVDDNFKPPKKWKIHFLVQEKVWVVYNVAVVPVKTEEEVVFVDVQYIIITKSFAELPETIAKAESFGVPLKRFFSKNKFINF